MHADLIEVLDGANDVGSDVALVVEAAQAAPHAHVVVLVQGGEHGVGGGVRVEPLLDLDEAAAVVELVRCVGGLRGQRADLPDEADLRDLVPVELEFGVGVRLLRVDELFDGYGAEGVFAEGLGGGVSMPSLRVGS